MPLKVSNENGQSDINDIVLALDYAVEHGANIINISAGADFYMEEEQLAIARAIESGCIVVSSSGNEGMPEVMYPSGFSDVISVGAVDKSNKRYEFSNFGENLDIMAPGAVYSPSVDGGRLGTSYSTPYVTGVIALLWQRAPELSGKEITNIVLSSTRWLDNFNKNEYGNGLIDACLSYEKILSNRQGESVDLDCDNYWYNANKESSSYKAMLSIGASVGAITITAFGVTLYMSRDKSSNKNNDVIITDVTEESTQNEKLEKITPKEAIKHEEEKEDVIPDGDITEQPLENINNNKSHKEEKKHKGIEI